MASSAGGVEAPKKTPVSEATRERETFRYDDSLFSNIRINDAGDAIPSTELATCPDAILTALARLAACQTGTARSLISLFDQNYQYVVAEATPTIPIVPSLGQDSHGESLWLCGTAIPRSHGVCEYTLCADEIGYFDQIEDPANRELPILVVDDLVADPRFSSKPYCQPGSLARFYAAVPIRTERGVNIGVLCVIDTKPGAQWEERHSSLLRELSRAVMEHLEVSSLKSAQRRSERKSQGLTCFVEGTDLPECGVLPQTPRHHPETAENVFSKAAGIVTDAIESDGCLFLKADMLEFGGPISIDLADDSITSRRPSAFSHAESEASANIHSEDRARPLCQILGALRASQSSVEETTGSSIISLPQALLARMIKRYPKGHVFSFDANGDLQPDELSSEQPSFPPSPGINQQGLPTWSWVPTSQETRLRAQQEEARILLDAFPGARSVAFVPIWDLRKERWSAGGFVYTSHPKRTFTIDLDLTYLRALGMLAAAEAFRLDTAAADKIKSDALGSLSHELRSPLHGAVLSVELLNDTSLTIPQKNIVHTIETCCRTLSDTIDHLLEYSKVNNLTSQQPLPESSLGKLSPMGDARPPTKVVQLDSLVEEVMESVYAGFNFQHLSIAQLSQQPPRRPGHNDIASIRRLDSMQAAEELDTGLTGNFQTSLGDVSVFLSVDPSCPWTFHTHAGPIRRIVMNLFGNSLKYTQTGLIQVSLEQSKASDGRECSVILTVSDTGIGIGEDFLQNGLFRPFAQENHLKPGTGLGLSFVKQMASKLGGNISVTSRLGAGTTVTVSLPMTQAELPLDAASEARESGEEFYRQLKKLSGLRVKILDFNKDQIMGGMPPETTMGTPNVLVQDMCMGWLQMQVNSGLESQHLSSDLAIWSEDGFQQAQSPSEPSSDVPSVVLCANALTAHQYATGAKNTPRPGIFEFISQPLGPRKLAKACSLAMYRWTVAQATSIPPAIIAPQPEGSLKTPDPTGSLITSTGTPFPLSAEETPKPSQDYFTTPEFLLVDDNFINLKILSTYMKKLKQPYKTANNGQEAVTAYDSDPGRYVCVLMDISMPIMDGFEATRRIRAFEQQQGLRPALILALTGLASEEAKREAIASGVDLFLTKPVRLKELGPILKARGVIEDEG
ncbi:hypothetical protein FDECE_9992 [Fusarium decemcellulare]|nr:hypothetical protein FDECE_9992 [Fusarium decemcellulare]